MAPVGGPKAEHPGMVSYLAPVYHPHIYTDAGDSGIVLLIPAHRLANRQHRRRILLEIRRPIFTTVSS